MLSRSSWAPLLDHEPLAEIASVCRLVEFSEGELIYQECEDADMMYLVSEGRVLLYKATSHSATTASNLNKHSPSTRSQAPHEIHNRLLRPSQVAVTVTIAEKQIELQVLTEGWFGQCAALGFTTRQCSARSLKRSQCLQLSWSALGRCLKQHALDVNVLSHLLGRSIMRELCHACFLHGLTTQQASLLCTLFQTRHIPQQTVVFEEVQLTPSGPSLYFCTSGFLTMQQRNSIGSAVLIRNIQAGQFFGEACMLFNLPRIATVRTLSPCTVAELPFSVFTTFLREFRNITVDATCAFNQQPIPVEHLLMNAAILSAFSTFLSHELSEENVQFWLAARKFRLQRSKNRALIIKDAQSLYEKFIAQSCENEVNLHASVHAVLKTAVTHGCVTKLTFEEAEQDILRLMESDSFSRFRASAEFEECLRRCRESASADVLNDEITSRCSRTKSMLSADG